MNESNAVIANFLTAFWPKWIELSRFICDDSKAGIELCYDKVTSSEIIPDHDSICFTFYFVLSLLDFSLREGVI